MWSLRLQHQLAHRRHEGVHHEAEAALQQAVQEALGPGSGHAQDHLPRPGRPLHPYPYTPIHLGSTLVGPLPACRTLLRMSTTPKSALPTSSASAR